jgi:hypothetical protein
MSSADASVGSFRGEKGRRRVPGVLIRAQAEIDLEISGKTGLVDF